MVRGELTTATPRVAPRRDDSAFRSAITNRPLAGSSTTSSNGGGSNGSSSGEPAARARVTPSTAAQAEQDTASGVTARTRALGTSAAAAARGGTATDRTRITPDDVPSQERQAVARPRGGNTGSTTARAVPRTGNIDRDRDGDRTRTIYRERPRRSVYVAPTRRIYYNNYYYYYPRDIYPYGYGAFGLGYFYYDPYAWAPVAHIHYDGYAYGYGYGYPTGELRLQVRPRHAEVYVDGYYAGQVDEFDGIFQSLRLEEGEYHIELIAPGYEPIAFDVRIQPGRKITYRGELYPERP